MTEGAPGERVPAESQEEAGGWLRENAVTLLILAAILAAGAYLRLSHKNWDEGTHIHPDERFLTMVTSALQLPENPRQFFDSTTSPMNPYNKDFGFFVYGTLPIFIVRVGAHLANEYNLEAKRWTLPPGNPDNPINMVGYDGVHLVGRALSGAFDLGCVLLVFIIGARLYGKKVGLLAAALYAFAVLPLQQSHFYTVDTFGTFFALLTFYFAVRVAQGGEPGRRGGGWITYILLGASLGASLASRINLAPLAGIALLAAGIRAWDDAHAAAASETPQEVGAARRREARFLSTLFQATLFRLVLMGGAAVVVFRVAQPYAFGGTSVLDFSFAEQWRSNMRSIRELIGGEQDYPPGHQWANRTPFVFPMVNMVYWGMGLPLGLTAWAGWLVAAFQILRVFTTKARIPVARAHILPVAWIGGMFLWQGLQFVQSMRYLLPIYPVLCVMAGWLLWWLVGQAGVWGRRWADRRPGGATAETVARRLTYVAYGLMTLVTVGTMLWGWGFVSIYRRPLSRIEASRWIYDNIPEGKVLANEHWDDALPFSIDGRMSFKPSGSYYGLQTSSDGQMQMYGEDTPEKRELLYQWLNETDYIVQSSNRLWGSIPRLPLRYPMSTAYYDLLEQGKLGFELAGRFTSFPTIFGIEFDDTWAEEAFSVYDHPEVRLYRKTPAYSEALVRSYLDPIDLENTILYWPKQVSASPSALYMDDEETLRQQSGGTWSEIFDLEAAVNRSPVAATLAWLAVIELLGLAAFPLLWVVLRRLPDRGYGLAKTAGVLALAWLAWFLPALKAAPYARGWIMLCLGLLVGAGAAAGWRRRRALLAFVRQNGGLILSEEALFLAFFLLFLLIRAGNPDLWHPARGGEKPMDFAYLNAVIRSTHFPPYDPWHAGGFINYYYFGFVIVGTLVKLTGIVPWVAYNLAVPTLFALTASGAFSVAFALADGDPATCFPGEEPPWLGLRIGSLLAGLAGAFFVTVVGNLGNLKLVFEQLALRDPSPGSGTGFLASTISALGGLIAVALGNARLDFPNDWWFWNASRAIPDTINEFPFFTFTYADLHAHMIALPLTLLALGSAVALARSVARPQGVPPRAPATEEPAVWSMTLPELLPLLLSGFVLGALRATNTWDFPTYALATVAALVVLEAVRRRHATLPAGLLDAGAYLFRAGVSVLWRAAIVLVVATVLFFPYGRYYATAYAGLQPWTDAMTRISDYLVVHGFVLLVVSIYLASEAVHQLRAGEAPPWIADAAPAIAALGVLLVGAGWVLGVRVWLIALPLAVAALVLAAGRNVPPARRLTLLWLALALAITMGVEVIRQKDDLGRMNTVFKFYMQAWTLFGVTAAAGLATWVPRALSWRPAWRALAYASTAVLFAATLIYPPTAARAKVRDRFSEEASPVGLDGMAYMDKAVHVENGRDVLMADDKAAMLWMLENVKGSPVILEAQLPEYRWGSRFSIYTGLPVVQGWNWHQRQQRSVVPGVAVERRVGHVQEIYNTTDVGRAVRLLDLYGVTYIVVGELERSQYAPEGLAKFDALASAGYLREAYRGGAVSVYEVVGRGQTSPASIPAEPAMRVVPTITPGGEPLSEERRKAMESEPELPTPAPFDSPGG